MTNLTNDAMTLARGHDELWMTDILQRFQPAPTEELHKILSQAAKGYWNSDQEWATAQPIEGDRGKIFPFTIERRDVDDPNKPEGFATIAHEQVVPVFMFRRLRNGEIDRTRGKFVLIHKVHRERSFATKVVDGVAQKVADEDGRYRYWDTYDCSVLRVADAAEVEEVMRELRSAADLIKARALDAWLGDDDELDADEVDTTIDDVLGADDAPAPKPVRSSRK